MSDSLWPHGLQHSRLPGPLPNPRVYSNSCPLSRWCHPTTSSSVIPFSSCLQSFPASGSFPMSQLFSSGSQSIKSGTVFPSICHEVPKCWLIGKDSDAGRDWGQEEKGMTEDEVAGWHHRLNGREFEWTPGVGDGQGGWHAATHGVAKSRTRLSNWTEWDWMPWSLFSECWILSQIFHSLLSPSSRGSLVLLCFQPWGWCHWHIWGYWYFSWQSWFYLCFIQPSILHDVLCK